MKKTFVCLLYHPAYLVKYIRLADALRGKADAILVLCRHPYLSDEMLAFCRQKFGRVIELPLIKYQANPLACAVTMRRFERMFRQGLKEALADVSRFNVVFNLSAYLPVNSMISCLRRDPRTGSRIVVDDFPAYHVRPDVFRSIWLMLFTGLTRLMPVFYDRTMTYMYWRRPYDKRIKFSSGFGRKQGMPASEAAGTPLCVVVEPVLQRNTGRDTVIIYGDTTTYDVFPCSVTRQEYSRRVRAFFASIFECYRGAKVIYKAHPNNGEKVMEELQGFPFSLYRGGLTSDLHLEQIGHSVKACYSVSSTSLVYSAYRGIPSYAAYRYCGFTGAYPAHFFEDVSLESSPYLKVMTDPGDTGRFDDLDCPAHSEVANDYEFVIS